MNAIRKAVDDIKSIIPRAILEKTFIPYNGFGRFNISTNIDEQIIANKGEQIDELSKDNQQMAKSLAEIESRNKTTLIYTITGTAIGVIMLTFVAALAIKAVNDAAVKSPNIANVHSSAMPLVRF